MVLARQKSAELGASSRPLLLRVCARSQSSRQVNSLSSFVNHAGSLLISSLKTEKGGHVVLKDIEMKARESKTEKKTLGEL